MINNKDETTNIVKQIKIKELPFTPFSWQVSLPSSEVQSTLTNGTGGSCDFKSVAAFVYSGAMNRNRKLKSKIFSIKLSLT